tara:strand:+ start:759 stop:878 length:120 start_codon:yes stop_codon:yes gene_type:complete
MWREDVTFYRRPGLVEFCVIQIAPLIKRQQLLVKPVGQR